MYECNCKPNCKLFTRFKKYHEKEYHKKLDNEYITRNRDFSKRNEKMYIIKLLLHICADCFYEKRFQGMTNKIYKQVHRIEEETYLWDIPNNQMHKELTEINYLSKLLEGLLNGRINIKDFKRARNFRKNHYRIGRRYYGF